MVPLAPRLTPLAVRTLTTVVDGLGDNWLQGQGKGAIAGSKEGREAQTHNTQIHHFLQLFGLLLQLPPLGL